MGYEEMLTETEMDRLESFIDSFPSNPDQDMPEFIDLADLDIDVDLLDILF